MMAQRNITDRAHRYRANQLAPVAGRVCLFCGSTQFLVPDHWDGRPDHTTPDNLEILCKSCNTAKGAAFKAAGRGRLTKQYNPTKGGGAANVGEWMQAVGAITPHVDRGERGLVSTMSTRDAVDMIRATSQSKRRDFAARLRRNPGWFSRPDARRTTPASGGIAYHTAKRRPATAKAAASDRAKSKKAAGLSIPDEKTFQEGFKRGLSVREIIAANPSLRKARASNPAKFDRCVKAVQAKGGAANAYAVCTAAQKRKDRMNPSDRPFIVDAFGSRLIVKSAIMDRGEVVGAIARTTRKRSFNRYALSQLRAISTSESLEDEILRESRTSVKAKNPAAASAEVFKEFRKAAGTRNPTISLNQDRFWAGDTARTFAADLRARGMKVKKVWAESDGAWYVQWSDPRLTSPKGGFLRASARGKNPAAASTEAFKEFHGFEPSEVITVTKKVHYHKHLAAAGELIFLDVWGIDNRGHKISGFKGAFLAYNETKNQLFVEGGDQAIGLKDFGITRPHELETLGRLTDIGYQTNKTHLGSEGGQAVYVHKFRTTNDGGKHVVVRIARYPDLIYDVRNEQLLFSGGSYEIIAEGIDK
jgi:hypothetical protein